MPACLREQMEDLDEEAERDVAREDELRAFGKQALHDRLQPAVRLRVLLALDAHNVHPAPHTSTHISVYCILYMYTVLAELRVKDSSSIF